MLLAMGAAGRGVTAVPRGLRPPGPLGGNVPPAGRRAALPHARQRCGKAEERDDGMARSAEIFSNTNFQ